MNHSAIDTAAIQRTLDRALAIRSSPLEPAELAELETLLLGHIGALLPEAQLRLRRLWAGSLESDRARSVLDRIARQAQHSLGHAPLADACHVTQLARDYRWLREWIQARDHAREHRT